MARACATRTSCATPATVTSAPCAAMCSGPASSPKARPEHSISDWSFAHPGTQRRRRRALPPAPAIAARNGWAAGRPTTAPTASAAAASPWLYHHLTISGPAAKRWTSFAEKAARGSGIVPWWLEAARLEEDIFNLAASQPGAIRSLTIDGCRILARQFRERVEDRAARAAARVGRSSACPFDLHTLLPVPAAVSWTLVRAHPACPDHGSRSIGASPTRRAR